MPELMEQDTPTVPNEYLP